MSQPRVSVIVVSHGRPDLLLRAEELPNALPALAGQEQAFVLPNPCDSISLSEIYTTEIEEACAEAYRRDYVSFGFGSWA